MTHLYVARNARAEGVHAPGVPASGCTKRKCTTHTSDWRAAPRSAENHHGVTACYERTSIADMAARRYPTEAHFVTYEMRRDGVALARQPRLCKDALSWVRGEGFEVVLVAFAADVDTPGHVPWTPELRAQMGAAAVAAAKSVGYVGAGTVEFICEQRDGAGVGGAGVTAFYFMEMNTRLQVEHPVTEAITGLDLVEWQLRVASGEPLPLTQAQITFTGHAIEARICAEQPEAGFLPAIGALRTMRTPEAARFCIAPVRIDSGVAEGDAISPHYDSMIAKLIVHGVDRQQALARMEAALAELQVTGLHHNVGFLRKLVRTASFSQAKLDTALIEREHEALFGHRDEQALTHAALTAASLRWWQDQARHQPSGPWSRGDGWALHGAQRHVLRWQVGDAPAHRVTIMQSRDGQLSIQVSQPDVTDASNPQASQPQVIGLLRSTVEAPHTIATSKGFGAQVDRHGDTFDAFTSHGHLSLHWLDPLQQQSDSAAHAGQVTAPMPGKVVALLVNTGDEVKAGQPLVVTEAMKMEHTLTAPRDGRVAELLCRVGDQVPDGAELLRIESD